MNDTEYKKLHKKCLECCTNFEYNNSKKNTEELLHQIRQCIINSKLSKDDLSKFYDIYFESYCFNNYLKMFNMYSYIKSYFKKINLQNDETIDNNTDDLMYYNLRLFQQARNLATKIKRKHESTNIFYKSIKKLNINYAVALNFIGRSIPSISIYMKHIGSHSDSSKYIGNIGATLYVYADLVNNMCIEKVALHYVKRSLGLFSKISKKRKILKYDKGQRNYLLKIKKDIIRKLKHSKGLNINNIQKLPSEYNDSYKQWGSKSGLILNVLNDVRADVGVVNDNIQLSKRICSHCPKIFNLFNLIKLKYMFARYTLYSGINSNNKVSKKYSGIRFTKNFIINYHIYQMEMAFQSFYSIFDKIACLINDCFHIVGRKHKVSILSLKNKNNINNMLRKYPESISSRYYFALKSLYWISRNIYDNTKKDGLDYKLRISNRIRNAIAHRGFYIIKDSVNGTIDYASNNYDNTFIMSWTSFYNNILHLARVIREVIILASVIIDSASTVSTIKYFPTGKYKFINDFSKLN